LIAASGDECAECQQLWREYSRAPMDHVELDGRVKLARMMNDAELLTKLAGEAVTAARITGGAALKPRRRDEPRQIRPFNLTGF